MKRNTKLILSVIFSIFFVGVLGVLISMNRLDNQTEDNTAEYKATISSIEITEFSKYHQIKIFTNEYDSYLLTTADISGEYIDVEKIKSLQRDEDIIFRIEKSKVNQFDNVQFINIVSLKTDDKTIFSLNNYNNYMSISSKPAKIAGVVVAMLLLFASVCFIISYKKQAKLIR